MRGTERGTGRTQKMIERAVASDHELVVIVAPSSQHFEDYIRRIRELIEVRGVHRARWEIERADGRRIRLVTPQASPLRGLEVDLHVDHAARWRG